MITRLGLGLSGFSQLLQESEHFDRWRLQLRTLLGKERRPPESTPATFVLSGSAHWTIFARAQDLLTLNRPQKAQTVKPKRTKRKLTIFFVSLCLRLCAFLPIWEWPLVVMHREE